MAVSHTASAASADPDADKGTDGAVVGEDRRTQRRRLAGVWLAVGSAPATMVLTTWYTASRDGRLPLPGDMANHAGIAQWMRTLDWWDWRGWSDWFTAGKAVGVSYPPLSHLWIRFTDLGHSQMFAVALGLLVLLPWGALRLSRAVGYSPRRQRTAVAAVLILPGASFGMYWLFSGFHRWENFGSWPDMLAAVIGLFASAWAAECRRPIAAGAIAGLAVLLNLTVVPGVAVVCAVLLASSGVSFRQGLRWAITAGSAGMAVCAWWLVPFVAGMERLVHYRFVLPDAFGSGGPWSVVVLGSIGVAAGLAARLGSQASRRLALAATAGLFVAIAGDLLGFNHAVGRWLTLPLLVSAIAGAGLAASKEPERSTAPVRPAWTFIALCFCIVVAVVISQVWIIPLVLWMVLWPRRAWCWGGALAWTAVLLSVALVTELRKPQILRDSPSQVVVDQYGDDAEGMVYLDREYTTSRGTQNHFCGYSEYPWSGTALTDGRVRPLDGRPYLESSPPLEFLVAETFLEDGLFAGSSPGRPHWFEAWDRAGQPDLYSEAAAEALGARWYAQCSADGTISVSEQSGVIAIGAEVVAHSDEKTWHDAAVRWWIGVATATTADPGPATVPALSKTIQQDSAYPVNQSAAGVSLRSEPDKLIITAEESGWAWLRVAWDPYWRSDTGTPVLKGGPGHLIAWVDSGTNTLRWKVPRAVDVSATAVTVLSLLTVIGMSAVNRRRGFVINEERRRPVAEAIEEFASTVDAWIRAVPSACRLRFAQKPRRPEDA